MATTNKKGFVRRLASRIYSSLGESRPLKSLSEKEKLEFYKSLGANQVAWFLLVMILVIMANTTLRDWSDMIWRCVGIEVLAIVLKLITPHFRVEEKISQIPVECEYEIGKKLLRLLYKGEHYVCEDYELTDGKLAECRQFIEDEENEVCRKEVYLIYDEDKGFLEQTITFIHQGISPTYKVVSWLFFAVNIALVLYLAMKLVTLLI